jgi:hypothetical protein
MAKGVVWSAIWPAYWLVYEAGRRARMTAVQIERGADRVFTEQVSAG